MESLDNLLEKYKFDPNKANEEGKSPTGEETEIKDGVEAQPADTEDKSDPKVEFDISQLKGFLGVEEDVNAEELKTRYTGWGDLSKKVETLEGEMKQKDEALVGYKRFVEEAGDPTQLYANDSIRFLNEVVKKYPTLDYSVASRLVTQDAKELSDIEAITIAEAMENSDYGLRVDEAELKLMKRLGVESKDELDELSATDKRLLAVDARKARALIARTQEEVKMSPSKQTPEEFLNKHSQGVKEQEESSIKAYEPIIDNLISKVEGVVEHNSKQLTTIKLDDAYKAELRKFALEQIGNHRMGADEKSQEQVLNNIQYKVWGDKRGEILSAAIGDAETRIKQEVESRYTNHQPVDLQREKPKEEKAYDLSSLTEGLPKTGWG